MNYYVGQTLWYAPEHGKGSEVQIAKLGRKWAFLKETWAGRFDMETGYIDGKGFTSPGRVFEDQLVYEEYCRTQLAWTALGRVFRHDPSVDIRVRDVSGAARLLGIQEEWAHELARISPSG